MAALTNPAWTRWTYAAARLLRSTGLATGLGRLLPGRTGQVLRLLAATRPAFDGAGAAGPEAGHSQHEAPAAEDAESYALLTGCVMEGLFGHVHRATRRTLEKAGYREIDVPEQNNVVQITDEISVEMKYPSYEDVASGDLQNIDGQDADKLLNVVASAISAVLTQEERFDTSTEKKEEVIAFLDSLTSAQFRKISEFLEGLPVLKQDVAFTCETCKTEKNVELRGLADFF